MDPRASPEARFLAFVRDRDPAVLEALLQEHADVAYTLARRLLGRQDLAEDAVQEACVRLLATADRYRPEVPFAAWFGRLVSAAAAEQRRRGARHQRGIAKAAEVSAPRGDEPESRERPLEALRAVLGELPERYRMPLSLYYFGGLDQAGVARALGVPPGTAAALLSRGLQKLRSGMARLGFAVTAAVLLDLVGGLPSYAAEPTLRATMTKVAATKATAVAAGSGGSGLALKLAVIALALVSTGGGLVALHERRATTTSGAALVAAMAPNSWARAPDSHLRAVAPDPQAYPRIQLTSGVQGEILSWSGAVLDTRRERLVVWGGGATNYAGNELYAFDIATLAWRRLTDPTPDPALDAEVNADGTPTARSTYNGLAYLAHADQLFARDGSIAGSGQRHAQRTWVFDFTSARWIDRAPSGGPGAGPGSNCSYDPATHLVWWGSAAGSWAGLWSYDPDANAWTRRNEDHFYEYTSAFDTRRGRLVVVGDGQLFTYEVRAGDFTRHDWKTTGGEAFVARLKPGFDYDAHADRFVGWSGGAVYALDPETSIWTAYDAPEAPTVTRNADYETGIYGRWRWVPSLDVFVLVTGVDDDVRFYKPAWSARD